MEANVQGLQAQEPNSPALERYDEIARLLSANADAVALDGVQWAHQLCADLTVAPLSRFGLREGDIEAVVTQAQKASSMKGNPLALTDQELRGILTRAL